MDERRTRERELIREIDNALYELWPEMKSRGLFPDRSDSIDRWPDHKGGYTSEVSVTLFRKKDDEENDRELIDMYSVFLYWLGKDQTNEGVRQDVKDWLDDFDKIIRKHEEFMNRDGCFPLKNIMKYFGWG